jgi:hypothetical protein
MRFDEISPEAKGFLQGCAPGCSVGKFQAFSAP